jgi:hypothetical protein
MILTLASTTTHTGPYDHVSLLGLVAQSMGLFRAGRAVARQNVGTLTVFPSTHTQQEAEGIRLLVAPQLFHILVATHCGTWSIKIKAQIQSHFVPVARNVQRDTQL